MVVRELLYHKQMLDRKIEELRALLIKRPDDNLADELIALIERRQSKLMNLAAANRAAKLTIGNQEIDVETAVTVRDSIKLKIDILTDIINGEDFSLDRVEMMKQRDGLYEDYTLLDIGILKSDLNTTIGE
jgi:hypothetical protein